MRIAAAFFAIIMVGCLEPPASGPPPMTPEQQADRRAAARAQQDQEKEDRLRREDSDRAAAREAAKATRAAEKAAAKQEQLRTQETDCVTDRAERLAIADAYRNRRDKQTDADNWKNEHCKSVDNSKPVVRRMQDSNGRIYFQEGRDRGVDIVCPKNDRTMPPEAKPGYEWPPLPTVSNQVIDRNSKCREVDEAAGAKTSP